MSVQFTPDMIDSAAVLLAERHRRHRLACPALNPAFEDPAQCAPLIAEALGRDAVAWSCRICQWHGNGLRVDDAARGVLGPNAWAEARGSAGDAEAIRECYAAIAGDLVDQGRKGHWAMVPSSDADLVQPWFSMSFGRQQCYAFRAPVDAHFEPAAHPGLDVRRATETDIPALAQLDMVLPNHVQKPPVFSTLKPPNIEEVEAELAEDINNPKYTIWVAEHDGRVVSEMVGVAVDVSSSWGPMMKPLRAGLLAMPRPCPTRAAWAQAAR